MAEKVAEHSRACIYFQNKCSVPHQTSNLVPVATKNSKQLVFSELNTQECSATSKKWFSMKENQVWVLEAKKIWSGSRYLPEIASNLHNFTFFLQIWPSRVSAAALSDSKNFKSCLFMFSLNPVSFVTVPYLGFSPELLKVADFA